MVKNKRKNYKEHTQKIMNTLNHTHGPWISSYDHVDDSRGMILYKSWYDREPNHKDSKLIGAAPSLLEALIMAYFGEDGWEVEARHAIFNATGGDLRFDSEKDYQSLAMEHDDD